MDVIALSRPGRFGSLTVHDPAVGEPCGLCAGAMKVGDIPALIEASGNEGGPPAEPLTVHETCLRVTRARQMQ
jgi:hypothetical protein